MEERAVWQRKVNMAHAHDEWVSEQEERRERTCERVMHARTLQFALQEQHAQSVRRHENHVDLLQRQRQRRDDHLKDLRENVHAKQSRVEVCIFRR